MSDSEQSGLPRTLVTLAVWLGLFGVLWGISAARDIIGPLFAALNLVIAAWPVRTALLKRGASPLVGTLALGLVVFLVLGLAMLALGLSVSALVRELPRYQGRFVTLYNQLVTFAASFGITQDAVLAQLKEISPSSVAGVASLRSRAFRTASRPSGSSRSSSSSCSWTPDRSIAAGPTWPSTSPTARLLWATSCSACGATGW